MAVVDTPSGFGLGHHDKQQAKHNQNCDQAEIDQDRVAQAFFIDRFTAQPQHADNLGAKRLLDLDPQNLDKQQAPNRLQAACCASRATTNEHDN